MPSPRKYALADELYAILHDLAERGRICPEREALAERLGVTRNTVTRIMDVLETQGRIRREGPTNHCREIVITATGKRTAKATRTWARLTAAPVPKLTGDKELIEAQTFLQSRHFIVYRADVDRGPQDRWVVNRRDNLLTMAEVIALAARVREEENRKRRVA